MGRIQTLKHESMQRGSVGTALRGLRHFFADNPPKGITGIHRQRLENIQSDYDLMLDYMRRGFQDAQRHDVYTMLFRRVMMLMDDCEHACLTAEKQTLIDAFNKKSGLDGDRDGIRSGLEGFVQMVAIQSLDGDDESIQVLYKKHFTLISGLFNDILLSNQWLEADRLFYTELLLSPTIDGDDACILTSAVMLSAMMVADIQKTLTLVDVYCRAEEEQLRQRALVGLAFSLPDEDSLTLYPECSQQLRQLCDNPLFRKELLELQEQVFLCMDADRDHETIQRDIMPTLLKNHHLRITRFGIEEIEEDSLQDILNPHAEDEEMEELEHSIERMMEMQRQGSDIYFGGFSQMKRFSFFHTLCNWFTPFNPNHPALANIRKKMKNNRFLKLLIVDGSFCDSDKYSFAFATSSIFDSMPKSYREMMNNQEALGPIVDFKDKPSAAYVRRMYIQDLFRFFRLYMQKDDFQNPFDYLKAPHRFFFVDKVFSGTPLQNEAMQLGRFLHKRKRFTDLLKVLQAYQSENSVERMMLSGLMALKTGSYKEAVDAFQGVLASEPGNERALKGMAQASFLDGNYEVSATNYELLVALNPGSVQYQLNLCLSKIHAGCVDDAIPTLYKLYYEHPEDKQVCRTLAWGMLMQHQPQQAERQYETLTNDEKVIPADYLNAGYCQWFQGNIERTIEYFRKYLGAMDKLTKGHQLSDDFQADSILLNLYAVGKTDQLLMTDLVANV